MGRSRDARAAYGHRLVRDGDVPAVGAGVGVVEGRAAVEEVGLPRVGPVTLPAAPTGVSATLDSGQVTVTWVAVNGTPSSE